MEKRNKKDSNYGRVMSRVINRSRDNLKAASTVTRHETPTAMQLGAKPSSSNFSRGGYRELPTVLKDYVPELAINKSRKSDVRVKPKKTLESLDPATSPLSKIKSNNLQNRSRRTRGSAPSLVNTNQILWSDSHYRQCLSSRSHTRLRELKDEIKEFEEREKLLKIRSHVYKKCGIVLNEAGQVSADKAVQVEDVGDSGNVSCGYFTARLVSEIDSLSEGLNKYSSVLEVNVLKEKGSTEGRAALRTETDTKNTNNNSDCPLYAARSSPASADCDVARTVPLPAAACRCPIRKLSILRHYGVDVPSLSLHTHTQAMLGLSRTVEGGEGGGVICVAVSRKAVTLSVARRHIH
ncbi:unnamed protein product [Danaus chrysippus]|uniref:(African queen) hypothetical protein n=1 Tax=Danaus chrysippus TaxID=151541 RepID=A0A8J2R6G3_9NEOP|nr:unnamed protein product [Danaus chrysippus]